MGLFDRIFVFKVKDCPGGENSFITHLCQKGIKIHSSGSDGSNVFFSIKSDQVNRLIDLLRMAPNMRGFAGNIEEIKEPKKSTILPQLKYSY